MIALARFAIAVAPNGARRTKADHPRLPMGPAEMAEDATRCLAAGAAMIHLHVRDGAGRHSLDAGLYREAVAAVRHAVGDRLLVQVTTEAVGIYSPDEQMRLVDELQPESASMALRELLPAGADEQAVAAFLDRTVQRGVLPQIIIYEAAELARLAALEAAGIVPPGLPVLAVLGRYHEAGASIAEFDAYAAAGIDRRPFMVCAFGPREAHFAAQAARAGGDARVGFENNLHLPDGGIAPDNAALVAIAAELAAKGGRRPASAGELRRKWTESIRQGSAGWAAPRPRRPGATHEAGPADPNARKGNVHNHKETHT